MFLAGGGLFWLLSRRLSGVVNTRVCVAKPEGTLGGRWAARAREGTTRRPRADRGTRQGRRRVSRRTRDSDLHCTLHHLDICREVSVCRGFRTQEADRTGRRRPLHLGEGPKLGDAPAGAWIGLGGLGSRLARVVGPRAKTTACDREGTRYVLIEAMDHGAAH